MPINLPSHAHGQGYTDLNWLIPETVSGLEVRKGPYFADVGDFASAGDLHVSLRDSVPQNIELMTVGSFGYDRFLTLGSTKAGGGSLLYAGEFDAYNGPWTTPNDVRKFSGLLRYSQGTATDGFSATAMAYSNTWNSTDQAALRALTTGQIGLYGALDPTDGGDSSRFSLSARMAQTVDDGSWKANAYLVKQELDLFNNYTYHLDDATNGDNGDQFHQHDDRVYGGAGASRTIDGSLFGRPTETVFGVQSRYDDITTGLSNTVQRQLLSNVLLDHIGEGNVGIYAENTVHWTDWLRTTTGWRGDYFGASVNSTLQPANSGNTQGAIGSPKFTMTFGPFAKTELFIGAGMGYHSNDARSTTVTEVPGDPTTPEGASPLLVRSRGAEVGVRTKAIPNLDSSISLFYLHQDSELFFDGDSGDTTAGLPSQRTGIEIHQRLPSAILAPRRRRHRAVAGAVSRFRWHAGSALPIARRLSAGADRQCAGQLRLQRAVDGGLGRHYARRKHRLVRRAALALHQFAAAHRGRRLSIAAVQLVQRRGRLPLRQRLERPARCDSIS